jgi:hypothetical protein
MKRASLVPPVVDSSGTRPVASPTAATITSVKGLGAVRKASPLILHSLHLGRRSPGRPRGTRPRSSGQVAALVGRVEADVDPRLGRAGMTLVAGLPTSTVVTSRFDGWKPV